MDALKRATMNRGYDGPRTLRQGKAALKVIDLREEVVPLNLEDAYLGSLDRLFSENALARICRLCGREFGGHRGSDSACEDLSKPAGRMFYPNPPKTYFKEQESNKKRN